MCIDKYTYIYFVGIGGIGMSALANYFNKLDYHVAGYDRNHSNITKLLMKNGVAVNFKDDISEIPDAWKHNQKCMVVYTPAIPDTHHQLSFFRKNEFIIKKRSEILGEIANGKQCIAVAGTHGKTSVSSLIAHLLYQTDEKCLAFLGGIAKNYRSNLLFSHSKRVIVEADEYDRSFLQLSPAIAIVTSMDADHLDIYKNKKEMVKNYQLFVNKLKVNGILITRKGLNLKYDEGIHLNYAFDSDADYYLTNLKTTRQGYTFDLYTPQGCVRKLKSPLVGKIYLENMLAAMATVHELGVDEDRIRKNILSFRGVVRRFDFKILRKDLAYIDDYAHHPKELSTTIQSIRGLFPDKKICGIFQPHLYSRTKDFANEFAQSLNLLDELILLPVYPAREPPIDGVNSSLIYNNVHIKKTLCEKEELMNLLRKKKFEVLVTFGAGDIDSLVVPIKKMLLEE